MNSLNYYFRLSYYYYVKFRGLVNYNLPKSFESDMTEVYPRIFVGNMACIYDKKLLEEKGIKNILSAVTGCSPVYEDYNYLNLDLIDDEYENIFDKFDEADEFIHKSIVNKENILVHCICGVSRSATLVTAHLIKKFNRSPEEMLELIKNKRDKINPNKHFLNQLELYWQLQKKQS